MRLTALFRLAFAAAPPVTGLTSPHKVTRRLILQEARRQTCPERHCPPTACKHAVSGSFNSPHRGPFHLSLTVLVHYRSPKVFSLGEWTPLLPAGLACPAVLKVSFQSPVRFRLRGCHSLCPGFPAHSTTCQFCNSVGTLHRPLMRLTTPALQRVQAITQNGFGLFPFRSPLLRE